MVFLPKTHIQYNHEKDIRQIPVQSFLQNTWLLKAVEIIKNKESLRNCHSTSSMGIQIYLCVCVCVCVYVYVCVYKIFWTPCVVAAKNVPFFENVSRYTEMGLWNILHIFCPSRSWLIDLRIDTISQDNYMIFIPWSIRETGAWELGQFTGSALKRSVSWGLDVALVLSHPIPESWWSNICHLFISYLNTDSKKISFYFCSSSPELAFAAYNHKA